MLSLLLVPKIKKGHLAATLFCFWWRRRESMSNFKQLNLSNKNLIKFLRAPNYAPLWLGGALISAVESRLSLVIDISFLKVANDL